MPERSGQVALAKVEKQSKKQAKLAKTGLQGMNTNDINGNASNSWLGLNWELILSSGWGVLGLNVARAMELDGRFKPVPLAQGRGQPLGESLPMGLLADPTANGKDQALSREAMEVPGVVSASWRRTSS